jgi:hypothetical protein
VEMEKRLCTNTYPNPAQINRLNVSLTHPVSDYAPTTAPRHHLINRFEVLNDDLIKSRFLFRRTPSMQTFGSVVIAGHSSPTKSKARSRTACVPPVISEVTKKNSSPVMIPV